MTPYHFVNNNPLLYIDPNGLDWYVNDSTGALHWYDGNYEAKGLEVPTGYSYFAGDLIFFDYSDLVENGGMEFGKAGFENVLKQLGDENGSIYLDAAISEKLANTNGFLKVPSEVVIAVEGSYTFIAGDANLYPLVSLTRQDIETTKYTYTDEYNKAKVSITDYSEPPIPQNIDLDMTLVLKYSKPYFKRFSRKIKIPKVVTGSCEIRKQKHIKY